MRSKNRQKHAFYRVFCVFRFPSNFDGFLIAYSNMLRKQRVLQRFSDHEATVPCLFFRCFCMFAFQKCVENNAFSRVFYVSSASPQTFVFSHPLRLEFMLFFSKHCKNIAFSHAFLIWTQTLCVFLVCVSSLVGLRASRNAHFGGVRRLRAFKTACFGCIWCFRVGQSARFGSVRSLRTSRNVCFGGVNIIWCLRTNENARFAGLRRIRISRNVWFAVSEALL